MCLSLVSAVSCSMTLKFRHEAQIFGVFIHIKKKGGNMVEHCVNALCGLMVCVCVCVCV